MPINYPDDGFDEFIEPTLPEETSLSSSGTGDRNHTEHHRDLGDAVEAIERNASLKGHDHSGDADDIAKGPKLDQDNTHENVDTDTAVDSIHHTIGPSATQAAAGNHIHDYNNLLNRPIIRCTSNTRPASPDLGLMIYEIDTNRFRIWAQFSQSNIANQGVYGFDDFERTSSTDLGADWHQTYLPNTDGGVMATPNGHDAAWVHDYTGFSWPFIGWPYQYQQGRCIARRIKTIDRHTVTDDQMITWEAGPTIIPWFWPWPATPSGNDFYLRMSDDDQSYTRVTFTYNPFTPFYFPLFSPPARGVIMVYSTTTGPDHEELMGTVSTDLPFAHMVNSIVFAGRTLTFYSGTRAVGTVVDRNEVSAKGDAYRGWGIGMTVGRHGDWPLLQRSHPSDLHRVEIKDPVYYTGNPLWQILPVANVPVCRLRQSFAQKLINTGTTVQWNEVLEDPFGYFNMQANATAIVIKEPGVYSVEAALQWHPQWVPDVAHVVFQLNGVDTTVRQSQFMRGNIFSPGFSQTIYTSGKIRFAANDVLTLRTNYTASPSILDLIFSFFFGEPSSQVKSRIDVSFLAP